MGRKCCVPNCMTNASPTITDDRKRFQRPCFRFPVDDQECKDWLERIPRNDVFRTKNTGVCILHFQTHFIKFTNKRYTLSRYAIPTIFDADPFMESEADFDVYPQKVKQNSSQEMEPINLQAMFQDNLYLVDEDENHALFNPETDVTDFDYLRSHLTDKLQLDNWLITSSGQSILIFNLNKLWSGVTEGELSIRSTINIDSSLLMKVFVKGIVVFSVKKIRKWTQIQNVIDKLQIKTDVNDMGFKLDSLIVVKSTIDDDVDMKTTTFSSSDRHLTLPEEGIQIMPSLQQKQVRQQKEDLQQMQDLQQKQILQQTLRLQPTLGIQQTQGIHKMPSFQQTQGLQQNQLQQDDLNFVVKEEPQTSLPDFEGYFFNDEQVKPVLDENVDQTFPDINFDAVDNTTCYTCSECGKEFDHHIKYMLHARRHDPKQCKICPICNKSVYGKMHRHLKSHGERTYVCTIDECNMVFKRQGMLKEHTRHSHFPGEFYCDICNDGENLRTKTKIRAHMRKHIDNVAPNRAPVDLEHNQFEWILAKQNQRQKIFSQSLKNKEKDSSAKKLSNVCPECGKEFLLPRTLKNHMRRHDPSKWKECPICKKRFPDGLSRHMNTHKKIKNHVCDICGLAYSQKFNLKIHKETSHFADKEFFCDICENGFIYRSREHLRVHLKSHLRKGDTIVKGGVMKYVPKKGGGLPEITFSCIECEATFNTRARLKVHTATVHTEEKEFSCLQCGKKFAYKSLLDSHEKVHAFDNKFSCHECGKCFKLASYLRKHIHRHKGEDNKRRVCVICSKKYVSNVDLRSHMKKIHGIDRKSGECSETLNSTQT